MGITEPSSGTAFKVDGQGYERPVRRRTPGRRCEGCGCPLILGFRWNECESCQVEHRLPRNPYADEVTAKGVGSSWSDLMTIERCDMCGKTLNVRAEEHRCPRSS